MKKNIISNNFFLLVVLSAIWGSAFLAIKISVETINPITVASLRLIIGSIILFLYFKYKDLKFIYSKKIIFQIFLIGFIGNFIPFSLISWSEMYIQSNTAGLLLCSDSITANLSLFDKSWKLNFFHVAFPFNCVLARFRNYLNFDFLCFWK